MSGTESYKVGPDLTEDFSDFVNDNYKDVLRSDIYIHHHPSVNEFCVYIKDKWSGYVPEEYIFKAGFEHYKLWSNEQEQYRELERTMDLVRNYVQTLVKFCKEKDPLSSDYLVYVQYFINTIRNRAITPEMQDFALERAKEWLINYGYTAGVELVSSEIGNTNEQHFRVQRTSRQVL